MTNKTDITSDLVVLEFQRRGTPYARNTEDFPQRVQISWMLDAKELTVTFAFHEEKSPWRRERMVPEARGSENS